MINLIHMVQYCERSRSLDEIDVQQECRTVAVKQRKGTLANESNSPGQELLMVQYIGKVNLTGVYPSIINNGMSNCTIRTACRICGDDLCRVEDELPPTLSRIC